MDAPPVQYAKTSDGFNIAYTVCGEGRPLIFHFVPFVDVQALWQISGDWLLGLSQRFQLIQFDPPGHGLSTRNLRPETTLLDLERDLPTVVDHLGLERFLLYAWAAPGHRAVRYAHAHPDRVSGLILNSPSVSTNFWKRVRWTELPKEEWDAFLSLLANVGDPPREEALRRMEVFRAAVTPEDYEILTRAIWDTDVEQELKTLKVPTLVLHPRNSLGSPIENSMEVAGLIPGARYTTIDDAYLLGNAAQGLAAIDAFVKNLPSDAEVATRPGHPDLSERELEVLRLLAQGKSNPEIAKELYITRNTVQNHVSSILIKTNLQNRAQAAVYAKEHGIV